MKLFLTAFLIAICSCLHAQKQIELQDVSKHIGDSVIVGGKVFSLKSANGGKLLLLNLGGAFPDQLLTIVLNEDLQKMLQEPLKSELQSLKVAGKVELYREKPQIVLRSPAQIQSLITEKAGSKEN
jgi:DNA/RNA endonuclease YhcR with UshA esterase domain